MTRKKGKPQHRETVTNKPNEGGFYKMLWNSMENDLGDSEMRSPDVNSPPVVISDQDSPQSEDTCDRDHSFSVSASFPVSEKTPETFSNDVAVLPESNDCFRRRKNDTLSSGLPLNEDGAAVEQPTSEVDSINNLLHPHPLPTSSIEPLEENRVEDLEEPHTDENFQNEENGEVCDQIELSGNTCMVDSVQPTATNMPNSTGQALSLLKSLLNQSDDDFDSHGLELNTSLSQTPERDIPVSSPSQAISNSMYTHNTLDKPMEVEPCTIHEKKVEEYAFPMCKNFLPSKIKIEPFLVLKSLKSLKDELKFLYDNYLKKNVVVEEKVIDERPESPDVEILQSPSLGKAACCVKVERLPDPFVSNRAVLTTDKTWKAWKSQIIRQRNEEKFRHLKVWRRGRTLLWRECELAGMDRVTYDEQVAFIKKHKLSESSSECEDSSSDETDDGRSCCESDEDLHSSRVSSPIHSTKPIVPPRLKKPLPKGAKYRSAAAAASEAPKHEDEYVVEHTTHNVQEGKKPLKITIRKTSMNKSEDEHDKTAENDSETFIVPSKPSSRIRKYYAAKTTYRKPEDPLNELKHRNIPKRSFYFEDNDDNQALLGRRSDEVENFNLLEKFDIPFEAPTLFRSPRVASRLAQLKNKETFTCKQYNKKPQKQPVSKDVKDVVELLCTRTVEAMLFPEATASPPAVTDSRASDIAGDSKKTENATPELEEPSGGPISKEQDAIALKELDVSRAEELAKVNGELSFDDDTLSSTDALSESSSKDNITSPRKNRKFRRKISIFRSPKRKKKLVNLSSEEKLSELLPLPAHTTQVPVVSEGPGQSPLQSEEDTTSKKIVESLKVDDRQEEKQKSEETGKSQLATAPRMTRSKQPSIKVDLDLIETLEGKRKKKKDVGKSPIEAPTVIEKPNQLVKKNRRSRDSMRAKNESLDIDNSNTQVDEVSEGPGEQMDGEEHSKAEEPVIRVLRRRVVNEKRKDLTDDELEQIEAQKGSEVPPGIPDSPMSPTPDAIEEKPPARLTRSKKRLVRERPSSITTKSNQTKDKTELETDNKVPHLSVNEKERESVASVSKNDIPEEATSDTVQDVTRIAKEFETAALSTDPEVLVQREIVSEVISKDDEILPSEAKDCEKLGTVVSACNIDMNAQEEVVCNGEISIEKKTSAKPDLTLPLDAEVAPQEVVSSPSDTKEKSGSDLNTSSERLAVLDALNSIRSSIDSEKKTKQTKMAPLPMPSLPGCIDLPLESLILPDELDDFADFGDLVVDEEFSEDENDDNPLAVRIKKIVQDQMLKNHEDELREGRKNISVKEALRTAVDKAVNRVAEVDKEESVDKSSDPSAKCREGDKNEPSQEDKENQDGKPATLGKKRESIDEKTGLPTSLIQRLRDPRIRSKLLSQLEESENALNEKKNEKVQEVEKKNAPVEVSVPVAEQVTVRDPRARSAVVNAPRRQLPAVPQAVTPQVSVAKPPVVAEVPNVKTPQSLPPITPPANAADDSDEEESIRRRPKKVKKQIDTELMYKSPLEDLNAESRPSYGRAPIRRPPPRNEGRRWDHPPGRRVERPERPAQQVGPGMAQDWWPQVPQEMVHFDPWRQPWVPGFQFPFQKPNPQAAYMETVLVNLALLPKTTNLNMPALKKIYHYFNMGNPQVLRIPPPTYDPKEETRTIAMFDPMGNEMIDMIQLPRPTSGLTNNYFDELPPDHSIDDIIAKPFMPLADVVDEEAVSAIHGNSFQLSEDEDEMEATIVKNPVIKKPVPDDPLGLKDSKVDFSGDPLENILQKLPLLKEQYSMNVAPPPPPPPPWTVDLRSPSPEDSPSPKKRRRSRSPRRRRHSPRRSSSSSRSRSRSPRRRRSRSSSSERSRRHSVSNSPTYRRHSTSISPTRKRHSKR